ncbi:HEAT repeat-containing protein [Neorhodopirellula lusitana]|uniref:HEAT repeat-containing protein n=1 Tax=Neorhodopirellula lusitana TaxID=445327 RepID=A0ABY1PVN1_9BACT|nr:HEAT repeat domain-containing protein [Neorhodopirellula lusitana]SMP50267.1 HEAT repeat-containing protein [Neorhodopirellula lusitana]
MYALKQANPYFSMQQWKADQKIGITDHERREELMSLAESMPNLPADRQQYWSGHLKQIFENDESAEMRRLAILAAGKTNNAEMLKLVEKGLDDDNLKVRMEACRALGNRPEDEAARLLASTVGKSQDQDVRHAAITALAKHPGKIASDSLKLALQDRDPATQNLVIGSLRQSTGQDYGTDPETWIAALDGKDVPTKSNKGTGLGSFF